MKPDPEKAALHTALFNAQAALIDAKVRLHTAQMATDAAMRVIDAAARAIDVQLGFAPGEPQVDLGPPGK
jgi:hypothetical protein